MMKQVINVTWLLVISIASSLCAASSSTFPINSPTLGKATTNSIVQSEPSHIPPATEPQSIAQQATVAHTSLPTIDFSPTATGSLSTSEVTSTIPSSPAQVPVSVNISVTYQTIDGFGATHNSLVYEGIGDVLGPVLREKAIEAAYQQVGLSLGNLEGALLESPGNYEQRSNDNDNANAFNWDGFQTFWADAVKSNVLDLAEPFGFNGYYLNQKVNIRWASPWLADLRSSDYPRYLEEAAEQIAAGSIYWRDQYGITPRYVLLFNEPLSGNAELLEGSVQEVVDLVKAAGARLEREGFGEVKFVLPNEESVGISLETATAVLSDPEARKYAGAIGYHTYPYGMLYASIPGILSTSGAGQPNPGAIAEREQLRQLSQQYGLPVWMTEVSHGDVSPVSYDDFRGRAIHIHDEMVYANASGYFGMNNMWDTVSQEMHFGNKNLLDSSNEGNVILIDTDQQIVYITGMGYAIGHYARWIKPGSIRVEATSGDPLLQVSAFRTAEPDRLVLVLINNDSAPKEIQVDAGGAKLYGAVSGEQSTMSGYWTPVQEFPATSPTGFETTLPPESVTTLALSLGSQPPPPPPPPAPTPTPTPLPEFSIYIPAITRQ